MDTLERLVDVVMLAVSDNPPRGGRTAYMVGGGGASVVSTDVASRCGLEFPELAQKTQQGIGENIMDVNTSTVNPVDLGAFAFDPDVVLKTIENVDKDNSIDLIIPQFSVGSAFLKPKYEQETISRLVGGMKKSLIPVISRISENSLDQEEYRVKLVSVFRKAGLPTYNSMSEAGYAITKLLEWQRSVDESKRF